MKRAIWLTLIALLVVALVPAVAGAQVSDETTAKLAELEEAIEDLGDAIDGGDLTEIGAAADAVEVKLDELDALGELDTAAFRSALEALGTAIVGGDLTEIATAFAALEAALADLVAQAAATTTTAPAATTTTAAPAGGVATGAGGTADTNAFPMSVFAGVGIAGLLLAGLYTLRRRSEG